MAKCQVCDKGPQFGQNVSFSQKKTKRQFKPNIQRTTIYEADGSKRRIYICTRCLRTMAKEA